MKPKVGIEKSGTMPEKKFRAGAVSATVWKNESKKGADSFAYYSVSLDRNYKDKDGQWKSTNSLRINDLPRASLVLNKAYEFILLRDKPIAAASSYEEDVDEEEIY